MVVRKSFSIFFAWLHLVLLEVLEVEFHLAFILRLEFTQFKVDGQQPVKATVVEEKIQLVVYGIHRNLLLTLQECEVLTELHDEFFQLLHYGVFQLFF